jgi:hypothetical protein
MIPTRTTKPAAGYPPRSFASPGTVDHAPLPFGGLHLVCVSGAGEPRPSGPLHLAYALIVYDRTATSPGSVVAAYTTSRPWPDGIAQPRGLFQFNSQEAAALGQARAFVLDARRLAYVPINTQWFPHLDRPDRGVHGRAPKHLRQKISYAAEELITRHTELIERLGPLWPR